jgi:hypothetical protein
MVASESQTTVPKPKKRRGKLRWFVARGWGAGQGLEIIMGCAPTSTDVLGGKRFQTLRKNARVKVESVLITKKLKINKIVIATFHCTVL